MLLEEMEQIISPIKHFEEYNGRVSITEDGLEVATVTVEFKKTALDDSAKETILKSLRDRIKEVTQVTMSVEEVPHGTLPRFEYKARRWTDERVEGLERVKYIEK